MSKTPPKRVAIFAFSVSLLSALQGCLEQETTGDSTRREIDRQLSAANEVESRYAQVKGTFGGASGASSILLVLDTTRTGSDSNLVPQPRLVGNLIFTPSIFLSATGQPMSFTYPVSGGQYDGSGDLSFTIQQNGNPTTVHCKVAQHDYLDCNWYSSSRSRFSLSRLSSDQAASALPSSQVEGRKSGQNQFAGTFVGENADFQKITASFRAVQQPQGGSLSTPQLSIVGNFVLSPRGGEPGNYPFPFNDGEYDPASSILAIKFGGDNPVTVDCQVQTSTSLHCTWVGMHGSKAFQEFDLKKSDQ